MIDRGGRKATAPFYLAAAATATAVYVTAGITTVAVYEDDSDDDEPYPVIVDEIAKTVVVHKGSSFQILKRRGKLSRPLLL